jgi:hypothetical protein
MYLRRGKPLPALSRVGSRREQVRTPAREIPTVKARETRRARPQLAS